MIAMSTGINMGFKRALPFVTGATLGFIVLLLVLGLGVAELVNQNALLLPLLKWLGAGYIAYMGTQIFRSAANSTTSSTAQGSFSQGFLLQWLNPKAWIACCSGIAAFGLAQWSALSVFLALYLVICYLCVASWALLGDRIGGEIIDDSACENTSKARQHKRLSYLNRGMGITLIVLALYLALGN